jgi:insulysin
VPRDLDPGLPLQKGSVYKPQIDDRDISWMTLPNNLRVLLISDPKTPTSICTLSFRTGSYEDPSDFLGLAHFAEHMHFLGSKK